MVRIVAGGDTITATNNHPFYLPQLGKYLRADSLRQNMKLLALTGALLTVHAVEAFDTTLQVYNFEVAEYHNYFVGEEGVLVHNDCVFVKAGLKSTSGIDGTLTFDLIDEALVLNQISSPIERQLIRDNLRVVLTLDPNREALYAFLRADDLVGSIPPVDIRTHRVNRVRAKVLLRTAPEIVRNNTSVLESMYKLIHHDLLHNIGGATNNQLANIHKYTALGDYLNQPMRNPIANAMEFSDLVLPGFEYQSYRAIIEGLEQLRQTSRLETGIVFRGRPLSEADYNRLFGSGSPQDIPVKGFVSCTRNIDVAEAFAEFGFPEVRYRMIWKIKSTNGVDINDISDWGENLGSIYHSSVQPPAIRNQQEVLLEEGYYRKLGDPEPIFINGEHKFDYAPDGTTPVYWYEVELEELGLPIRQISN